MKAKLVILNHLIGGPFHNKEIIPDGYFFNNLNDTAHLDVQENNGPVARYTKAIIGNDKQGTDTAVFVFDEIHYIITNI